MTLAQATELWAKLPHPPGSVVRWNGRKDGKIVGDYAASPRELMVAANAYADHNLYVQLNPTADKVHLRPTSQDITHWSWFLLDVDPVEKENDPAEALGHFIAKVQGLMGIGRVSPLIIDSGRGMQGWFRLPDKPLREGGDTMIAFSEPLPKDWLTADYDPAIAAYFVVPLADAVRKAQGYWLNLLARVHGTVSGCRLDPSVGDLPRLMRMPYTVNHKTGRLAQIISPREFSQVSLIDPAPEEVFVHETLPYKILHYAPRDVVRPSPPLPPEAEGLAWKTFVPALNPTARNFILVGAEETNRHNSMVAAVKALREAGCSEAEARKAVYRGARLSRPKLEDTDSIERALVKVYGG